MIVFVSEITNRSTFTWFRRECQPLRGNCMLTIDLPEERFRYVQYFLESLTTLQWLTQGQPLQALQGTPRNTEAGPIPIIQSAPSLQVLEKNLSSVLTGGRWHPGHCQARHRVALVVPYRNREEHLRILMQHLHPFLQRQSLEYAIFVIEQVEGFGFNRGALFNIGYREVTSRFPGYFDCFIFHDVDLLPEDDRMSYGCTHLPRHLAAYMDKFNYQHIYLGYTGGVIEISTEMYNLTNGFSNMYFGWGGEDDDFTWRIDIYNITIIRFPASWGRYTMIKHEQEEENYDRAGALKVAWERQQYEGLNTLQYDLLAYEERSLYTTITVAINKTRIYENYIDLINEHNLPTKWIPQL